MSTPVRRALYGRLAGDMTLNALLADPPSGWSKNIFHNEAPEGASYPFVVFNKTGGTPHDAFHRPGTLENDLWHVKCVDQSASADVAESVADRVKALLNDASLSISGATLVALRRIQDIEYPEVIDGDEYQHVGAMFRLYHT